MGTIAVIADVHGNLEALQAVLARIDVLGVEAIYCLGDVVGYGPDPEACVRITEERCRMRLMGNHEHAMVNAKPGFVFNKVAQTSVEWTRRRLHEAGLLERISGLEPHHQEGDVLYVHGSARDALQEYVLETDENGHSTFEAMVDSLERDFSSFRLCFVGHNHQPFLATTEGFLHPHEGHMEFQVLQDDKLYVSVGSVGQPRDGDPRACFVTFDGLTAAYHRVPYPYAVTMGKIRSCGLPGRLADRLALGR